MRSSVYRGASAPHELSTTSATPQSLFMHHRGDEVSKVSNVVVNGSSSLTCSHV